MKLQAGFPTLLLIATTSLAQASPVTFIERSPADQEQISVTVDQSKLEGTLSAIDLADLIEAGRRLFATKFTQADGAGRPAATQASIPTHFKHPRNVAFQRTSGPDANSCTSCHNDPISGGAGDFTVNAFTAGGTESADFDNVDPQFSNERGTNHMFGSGLMELLAREMSADLLALRDEAFEHARETGNAVTIELNAKGISFGKLTIQANGQMDVSQIEGVDSDLVIRPFSQKGVVTSLRMFTLNAMNAHHGMQGDERFAQHMTGEVDFDGDGFESELNPGAISALVAYQATLEVPVAGLFDKPAWQELAAQGETLFASAGCATCHVPALPLKSLKFMDPGPYDTAGTLSARDVKMPATYDLGLLDWAKSLPRNEAGEIMVPLFGDLKRHVIADNRYKHFANELMGQSFVPRNEFMTSELWGVADTAPYGHRGDLSTLQQVILAHGGAARQARDQFAALEQTERDALVTYLKTLRMPK